jgi:hypothetical protein
VREERKLKLKLVVTTRFQWRFEPFPRHSVRPGARTGRGSPIWQRQTAINLRLLLQTQHSPPIAESSGPVPMGVEMPVRLRLAELRSAVV